MRTILALVLMASTVASASERVACVGDSITQGVGVADQSRNYPSSLARLLGPSAEVKNFGHSGATLLKAGDLPYWTVPEFTAVDAFAPTLVLIMLGTNDSKPQNWAHQDGFAADLAALVEHFRALPSKPKVAILLPPTVYGEAYGIRETVIVDEEIPLMRGVAAKLKAPVIDVHAATAGHPDWFPDRVHPAADGMQAIAAAVADALNNKAPRPR